MYELREDPDPSPDPRTVPTSNPKSQPKRNSSPGPGLGSNPSVVTPCPLEIKKTKRANIKIVKRLVLCLEVLFAMTEEMVTL